MSWILQAFGKGVDKAIAAAVKDDVRAWQEICAAMDLGGVFKREQCQARVVPGLLHLLGSEYHRLDCRVAHPDSISRIVLNFLGCYPPWFCGRRFPS